MSDAHSSEPQDAVPEADDVVDVEASEQDEGAVEAAPSELDATDRDGDDIQAPAKTDAERAAEYLALAQRTQADFENYRKRAARDARIAQERGVAKLAKELLPAIDNLERAIQAAEAANDPLIDGVRLVQTEMLKALSRVGIEPFSPTGEVFDPQHHEAVAQAPIPGAESGTVVEVYQQGFRQGETVLRPARVLVAA